jgi:filamentous hemagglutinin family protein
MDKNDIIFLFILAAFVGYYMCKSKSLDSFEGFAAIDDARQAVREVYNADVDAIRGLSEVAKKLQAGGLTIPGTLKITPGQTIEGQGRLHVTGPELLYILNKNGVVIGKEWGGNGNLSVQGNINSGNGISTDAPTWNGWISGLFGVGGGKDRVVLGNLENQATVGSHNQDLNAWRTLRLQGEGVNIIPNSGAVNISGPVNAASVSTSGGISVGDTITGKGRLHVNGPELLYILNKNGVIIGKEWGGNGNLQVQGSLCVGGECIDASHIRMLRDGFYLQVKDAPRADNHPARHHANASVHMHGSGHMAVGGPYSAFQLKPITGR